MQSSDLLIYFISFIAFLCVLALIEGLYLMWGSLNVERKVKVRQRLRQVSTVEAGNAAAVSLLRETRLTGIPALNRLMLRVPRFHLMDRMLEQAGLEITVARYLAVQLLLVAVVATLLFAFTPSHPLLALAIALATGIGLPLLYVRQKRSERLDSLTRLLPDTMDYLARSMRAGNPFIASLKVAAAEMPEPIAGELRATFDEMNFGLETEQALNNLCTRTGSGELRYFVTAVLIQRSTGGNLAEVLTRIAVVMRSRASTVREIIVLATEMKYSANVLIALPFFVAGIISVVNPGYLDLLLESRLGIQLVLLQLLLMGVGYYVIQKMINFRL